MNIYIRLIIYSSFYLFEYSTNKHQYKMSADKIKPRQDLEKVCKINCILIFFRWSFHAALMLTYLLILGVNLGYHSKKFYPLIKISILSVRIKLFVSPLAHSLKTYDSFLFIDKQRRLCSRLWTIFGDPKH
jgi:hypothetical protein